MIKKNIKYFLILLIILLSAKATASIDNKIIVKVEDEIITSYELKNKILTTLFLSGQEINQTNINNLKKASLDSLILEKLKITELRKYEIKNDNIRTSKYLNSISSNNIKDLINRFKMNNLNFDLYKKEIETQMMWQEFVYNFYSSKINLDENTINSELNNQLNRDSKIKEFKISEIEIRSNLNEPNDDKIKEVQTTISNIGFANAATKLSISSTAINNGEIGWISSNSMSDQIKKIIFSLKIGEVSKPIIQQDTITFLKLQDMREIKINKVNIDELKKKIIDQKKNELYNLYSRSHLSKLKNISFIEYK